MVKKEKESKTESVVEKKVPTNEQGEQLIDESQFHKKEK